MKILVSLLLLGLEQASRLKILAYGTHRWTHVLQSLYKCTILFGHVPRVKVHRVPTSFYFFTIVNNYEICIGSLDGNLEVTYTKIAYTDNFSIIVSETTES